MSLILQVFYTFFSAVLLSLAIPNELLDFGSPLIAFAALIPYCIALKHCKNFKESILLGFIHTFVTHMISSFWLANFKDFAAFTLGASAVGTGCIGAAFGAFFHIPYRTKQRRNFLNVSSANSVNTIPLRVFYFAIVYTFYEWTKSAGFLGYPWGTISSCMFRARLFMQLSAITGTYGVTFLTALFAAIIAEGIVILELLPKSPAKKLILFSYRNTARIWVVLFSFTMIYGLIQYQKPRKPLKKITTILVQQNENPWDSASDNDSILLSQELTEKEIKKLNDEGKKPDLIVWSEGCLKYPFPEGYSHYERWPGEKPLISFIKENNTPLLAGGSFIRKYKDDRMYFNSALVFDKNGKFRGAYGKLHLVPFAEIIPFTEYPAVKKFLQKVVHISAGWSAGDQYTYFDIPCDFYDKPYFPAVRNISLLEDYNQQINRENNPPVTRISTPICFDDSFTDVCRPLWKNGSEVFMNITDDSWSLKKSAEYQHFVIASYRAIEYRTTMVRSTNAGYSVIMDPSGRILADLPLFEA